MGSDKLQRFLDIGFGYCRGEESRRTPDVKGRKLGKWNVFLHEHQVSDILSAGAPVGGSCGWGFPSSALLVY